jgi:hypothetical protein
LEVRPKKFPAVQTKLSGSTQTWGPQAMFSTKNQFKIPRKAFETAPHKSRAQQARHLIKGL